MAHSHVQVRLSSGSRLWRACLASITVLTTVMSAGATADGGPPGSIAEQEAEAPAADPRQNPQGDWELIGLARMQRNTDIPSIGSLLTSPMWKGVLPLTAEQKNVITKLNQVLCEARYQTRLADAASLPGDPTAREQFLARSWERQLEAIRHGIRLVSLGLLTEEQAAFVTQRDLGWNGLSSLYADKNVAEILGLSREQTARLDLAREKATANSNSLMAPAFGTDAEAQREFRAKVNDQKRDNDAAVKNILTSAQLETWDQLTSERPAPAKAPDSTRSAVLAADAAGVRLIDLSPVFRAVAEKANALGLSADQKSFVKDLEDVTRTGYVWIGRRNAEVSPRGNDTGKDQTDRISQVRSEFLKRAELIVLLGILRPAQAEQVQAGTNKN